MTETLTKDIPVGDVQFYDNFTPALGVGKWRLRVEHTVTKDGKALNLDKNGKVVTFATEQEFVVSGPQFSLPDLEVINRFPAIGSTGRYSDVLPHIVLANPLLPWERSVKNTTGHSPWLALLVLDPSEIIGPEAVDTRAQATTVGEFLKPEAGIIKPVVTKEDDIADDATCFRLRLPVSVFRAVTPQLDELRFLSHCRRVNTGDKAIAGVNEHGLFSVVIANRFPKRSTSASALRTIVHLVAVEGLEPFLTTTAAFGDNTAVDLVSLARWTFQTQPERSQDFHGLAEGLVSEQEKRVADAKTLCPTRQAGDACPDKAWLRLPQHDLPTTAAGAEAAKRLANGFTPLPLHARTGEKTFAWYRGPLTPVLTTNLHKKGSFQTSDAALIYDPVNGVFDMSLAAAWNIGRSVALADRSFGRRLLDLRRRGNRVIDDRWNQSQSRCFPATPIQEAEIGAQVQDLFLRVLDTKLISDIGAASRAKAPAVAVSPTPPASPSDPKAAIAALLADEHVQEIVRKAVAEDVEPIAEWLARLMLLYPVPFDYLVPDAAMLPVESLRFFHMDHNWLAAMVDGALSIGLESSRQTVSHTLIHDLLQEAALAAANAHRHGQTTQNNGPVSGFVMRSALVSGWPNLAIRPRINDSDEMLRILRLDHMSPSVLLCVVDGVPDYFEFSEPQEGLRFGTDDDGNLPLRKQVPLTSATDAALGEQLPGDPLFQLRDLTGTKAAGMRSPDSRVLNIAPNDPNGLIATLTAANQAHSSGQVAPLGPGGFALQMVKSPEAIKFLSRNGQ